MLRLLALIRVGPYVRALNVRSLGMAAGHLRRPLSPAPAQRARRRERREQRDLAAPLASERSPYSCVSASGAAVRAATGRHLGPLQHSAVTAAAEVEPDHARDD